MDPIVEPVVTVLTDQPVANYLTLALVLITGWYAWHTRQTVKAMREQNERLIRPYVTVRLTRDRTEYILLVENSGRTPAKDLRLRTDQEFHCLGDPNFALSNETLFAKGAGTFPPGAEIGPRLGGLHFLGTSDRFLRTYRAEISPFSGAQVGGCRYPFLSHLRSLGKGTEIIKNPSATSESGTRALSPRSESEA